MEATLQQRIDDLLAYAKEKRLARQRERNRRRYRANPERQKDANKNWYRRNRDHRLTVGREWYDSNKSKRLETGNAWRATNRDKVKTHNRRTRLKNKFGLTQDDVENMLRQQEGKCANPACGAVHPGRKGNWHVDHNHTTGKIRGLLCLKCNVMLGMGRDNPTVLRGGAEYLDTGGFQCR